MCDAEVIIVVMMIVDTGSEVTARMSCELDWVVDSEGGNVSVEPLLSGSKWAGLDFLARHHLL